MSNIYMTAMIETLADNSDAFEALLVEFEKLTNLEPGCLEFRFFRDIERPGRFTLWECFRDQAALTEHMNLPHTKELFAKGLITNSAVTRHYKVAEKVAEPA